jgi:hypothetical protein
MPRKRARPVREGVVGKGANTATSPATYFTSRTVPWEPGGEIPPGDPTNRQGCAVVKTKLSGLGLANVHNFALMWIELDQIGEPAADGLELR